MTHRLNLKSKDPDFRGRHLDRGPSTVTLARLGSRSGWRCGDRVATRWHSHLHAGQHSATNL